MEAELLSSPTPNFWEIKRMQDTYFDPSDNTLPFFKQNNFLFLSLSFIYLYI